MAYGPSRRVLYNLVAFSADLSALARHTQLFKTH